MVAVGRPREFDEQEVLDKALGAFWAHGYEATSMSDLVEATGLKKGSLYLAFGDKRALFLRALQHYLDQGRSWITQQLEADQPLMQRLRAVLLSPYQRSEAGRGCFAVNCLVELAPHDPEVKALLSTHFRATRRQLERALSRALEAGEVRAGASAAELAQLLQTLLTGAAASSKGLLSAAQARRLVELALDRLLSKET